MNRKNRGILVGMAIGDGYICKQGQSAYSLRIEHSQKQIEYLEYKKRLLESIFGGRKINIYYRERYDRRTHSVYKQCSITKGNIYFKYLLKRLYPFGKKKYTRQILDYLTPEGIAIWYMDDGYIKSRISKKTNSISSCQTYISTYCSAKEAQIIVDYFKEVWDIHFSIHTRKKTNSCTICANTAESVKFIELVAPYIIPSMNYKMEHLVKHPRVPDSNS